MKPVDHRKIPFKVPCTECPLRSLEYFREFTEQELAFMLSFKMGELSVEPGTSILKEYVRRTGTLEEGLQFYNGALWDGSAQYARKVLAEHRRLQEVARAADGDRA